MNFKEKLEKASQFISRQEFREAARIYQEILKTDPNHTLALHGMGEIALGVESLEKAEDYFQRSLAQNPNQYQGWLKLGHVCSKLRKPEKALQAFRNAVKLEPGKSQAYMSLGHALQQTGNKEEAIQALKKAFSLDRDSPQALRLLAPYAKLDDKSPLAGEALKRIDQPGTSTHAKANLSYGLAYIYENMGDDEKFLHYLRQANDLQKEDAPPWKAMTERNAKVLKEIFTLETFKKSVGEEDKTLTPIFIVGMPRSGTTLTEQIITSHPEVFGADEIDYMTMFIVNGVAVMTKKPYLDGINEVTRDQLRQLSHSYQQRLQKFAPEYDYITDKYLSNFLSIGLIRLILPWAKVISLSRHPMDNAFSIYRNYFLTQLAYCYDLKDMAHYYHIYREMIEFWDQLLPGFVCQVNYEDLVENFESEARRIIDFCGLPWDDACLAPDKNKRSVMTLSQDQVRQPIYNSSIGKWKKYRQELEPFRKVLENYGYKIED